VAAPVRRRSASARGRWHATPSHHQEASLRHARSNQAFVERFDGRLSSLGRAHSLLVKGEWRGADLAELAPDQLAPYTTDDPDRLRVKGEALLLPADLATPFGLVLHELATNAAKYGSLSRTGGTVELSWNTSVRNNQRVIRVVWQEKGGPPVSTPASASLGTQLIDNVIPHAKVRREFRPDGLVCSIEVTFAESADRAAAQ
jgi:two-component system CheB/CheR fusion protein